MFGRRDKSTGSPDANPVDTASQARLAPKSPSDALKPTAAPPPPPRVRRPRGGLLSMLSGALTFLLVFAAIAVFGILWLERAVEQPGPLADEKIVLIPKNTGTAEITELLTREGVIDQPRLFELYAYLNRKKGQLRAGEYLFKAHTNVEDAISTLIQGKSILHSFTAPEGLTSEQIVQRLRENDVLVGDINDVPREGTLLPDTYKFDRGTTRQQLLNMMQSAGRQALAQVWASRAPDVAIKTPQELIILASIVEKETGKAEERPRVAGVYLNRLARRMKLQSDPTIVYGIVGGKGTLGRGILRSEIERATPYNTYVIEGLPPGPIANPGRAALEAVANPTKTKDLYFVADGTGGHTFAETYDQHQRNVLRWRQIEKAREAAGNVPVDRVDPVPGPDNRTELDQGGPASNLAATSGSRGSAFDASEGTNRDPLRNQRWDLSSAKSVPSFSNSDPMAATAAAPARRAPPRRQAPAPAVGRE
jgi:UPF0755 protein